MDPQKERIVRLLQLVLFAIGEVVLIFMGKWYYGLFLLPTVFEPLVFFIRYFKNR